MKSLRAFVGVALLMLACGQRAESKTLVVLADSIYYGYDWAEDGPVQLMLPPPAALQALLRRASKAHPWRHARVRNYAVPGTWTGEWITGPPRTAVCQKWGEMPHVAYACTNQVPLVEAVLAGMPRYDGVLLGLGLNDGLSQITVAESADNLALLAARMGGQVWIGAPTHVTNSSTDSRRAMLRDELVARGMLNGVDPVYLPLLADGVHLDESGGPALGALWFGVLVR